MTSPDAPQTLVERARASAWIAEIPGLADDVARLDRALTHARASLHADGANVARAGRIRLFRAARHALAMQAGGVRWMARQLVHVADHGAQLVRHPTAWVEQGAAEILREELALLGPSAAELARIVQQSDGIAPPVLVDVFRRDPITTQPLLDTVVHSVVADAFGDRVSVSPDGPLAATPATQLHAAWSGRHGPVLVRVLRPGIRQSMLDDARIVATVLAPLERTLPLVRHAHPNLLIEMTARQALEETDLRFEALNVIELGLALEDLGLDPHAVCRPLPGLVHTTCVIYEPRPDAVPLDRGAGRVDVACAVPLLMGVTLESAVAHGIFHGDLRPEHLLVNPDGSLVITSCSTLGRLDRSMRDATFEFLISLLSGDPAGQVRALQQAGAVSQDTDLTALAADLETVLPNPLGLLAGGDSVVDTLRETLALITRHKLRPSIELVLFGRTVYSTRAMLKQVVPELQLVRVLLPMIPRLSELAQRVAMESTVVDVTVQPDALPDPVRR